MLMAIKKKIKNIKYKEEKRRLIIVGIVLVLLLFAAFGLLARAFASYQSNVKLNANIDQALYIFGGEKLSFNIDPVKIVPSTTPYTYKFSVANFDANKQSDVNLEYTIDVKTTTNLPIQLSLYRNGSTTNLLSNVEVLKDSDGSWYRVYKTSEAYRMNYEDKVTDIYTFSVLFPAEYSQDATYADAIENIEITLKSGQIIS